MSAAASLLSGRPILTVAAGLRVIPPSLRPRQAASPACTELETVMMDWLGQMLRLPEAFLSQHGGEGGGVIQVRCGAALGAGPTAEAQPRGSAAGARLHSGTRVGT